VLAHSVYPAKTWELVAKDTGTRCRAKGTSDVQEGWLGIARHVLMRWKGTQRRG
jgi:hypothetical protein